MVEARKENTGGAPSPVASTMGGKMNGIIELQTDDENGFVAICNKLGYAVKMKEIESSMVEHDAIIYLGQVEARYSYLQGLRYVVYAVMRSLERMGKIEIVDVKWRNVCNLANCNHITHYAEEPFLLKIKLVKK